MTQSSQRSANEATLQSYELTVEEYLNGTPTEVSGNVKIWIDEILKLLASNARIIEIGSAFGRDADYIESKGFKIERTDAAGAFVKFLQEKGASARVFNILNDDFIGSYDLIFANAVFLHFTPQEMHDVLVKSKDSLNDNGILAFSLKRGEGEEWTTEKVGHPRYYCYWDREKITSLLELSGFKSILIDENEKWMQIIAQ